MAIRWSLTGALQDFYILLHFRNTSSCNKEADMEARWGLIMMPPWLKTLSIGAEEAGMHSTAKLSLASFGKSLLPAVHQYSKAVHLTVGGVLKNISTSSSTDDNDWSPFTAWASNSANNPPALVHCVWAAGLVAVSWPSSRLFLSIPVNTSWGSCKGISEYWNSANTL